MSPGPDQLASTDYRTWRTVAPGAHGLEVGLSEPAWFCETPVYQRHLRSVPV